MKQNDLTNATYFEEEIFDAVFNSLNLGEIHEALYYVELENYSSDERALMRKLLKTRHRYVVQIAYAEYLEYCDDWRSVIRYDFLSVCVAIAKGDYTKMWQMIEEFKAREHPESYCDVWKYLSQLCNDFFEEE